MLALATARKIRVMLTPFRDGLQSSFGGKTRLKDILPAMEFAAKEAAIRHFEFGGGARFHAPYFYLGEDPFACQDAMRRAVGPQADLQILTRSVSGVTLTTQRLKALDLQAHLMVKHGTTWDRNFDYMNDVDNLERTGRPIVAAGMHHQVSVAMMGLPFRDDTVHTPEFYVAVVRALLGRGVHFDSVCMKDASGTTDPKTCYETARGLKAILPPEIPLWQHTHDTASIAVSCYLAGLEGGVDGIDLSVRPLASGTVQPDARSMWHALKGTGCVLDIDVTKMAELEKLLDEGLAEYQFDPVTTTADARVVNFPMPGGAIGPNVHMMKEAGILHKYGEVLAEFPVVVKAGGAWTSVTPGSQQYWLQAFNNVLLGRWKKIDEGYGKAVLGYFGRPPLPPDPEVVRIASEQLGKPPFSGDPLEAAPNTLQQAQDALHARGLPMTDENIFLVASAMVPGKNVDLNEGIRFLTGNARTSLPLKKSAAVAPSGPGPAPAAALHASEPRSPFAVPVTTTCIVEEHGRRREFRITIAPSGAAAFDPPPASIAAPAPLPPAERAASGGTPVFSPFEGKVELVALDVHVGDAVKKGQVVAGVEAMKAKHDVKAPCAGHVVAIHASLGTDVTADQPILTIGA
ncbi:MAG TPA: biotin/lipoyl-containing protein [Vicinamibacterales bacterium]|nr:biotin/lipoyl-containing protein [Vicinamibacterales bacterium]